ncbi:MAG: prepilin-type N-terminal cleavage/methylation domain-containing protein [Candidatus Omnitrophica bacterium]|nr:prepilin-type N-terminal cleavage/methylation domain-containing protein [Candidatus Omnitrophota bacterium]
MGKRAFTLIELIVVIAIIAVLAAIIAPNAFRAVEKSKIAACQEDSKSIKTAAYSMYSDTGMWPGSNWIDDAPTDPLAGAAPGEGFVFKGANANMPGTWDGPYLEKWKTNPWVGTYYWDYNAADQNGDGINNEHVLWIDNGNNNAGKRIPLSSRVKIDQQLDDGDLHTGRIQVWQGNDTSGNLGYILIQGE